MPLTVLSSVINAISQRRTNQSNELNAEEQRVFDKKMSELAYQQNLDQWYRENSYNSPSAQMQRYKDAGLNPNLIYGQSNLSASSPQLQYKPAAAVPKLDAPQVNFSNVLDGLLQIANAKAEIEIKQNNAELSKYQSGIAAEELLKQKTYNEYQRQLIESDLRSRGVNIDKTLADTEKVKEETKNVEQERRNLISANSKIQQEIDNLVKSNDLMDSQIKKYQVDLQLGKLSVKEKEILNSTLAQKLANELRLQELQQKKEINNTHLQVQQFNKGTFDLEYLKNIGMPIHFEDRSRSIYKSGYYNPYTRRVNTGSFF